MPLNTVLNIALDVAFVSVFTFTLVDYLRHREPVRRAVVLVFGSLMIVLASPVLTSVLPAAAPLVGVLVLPALLIQPVLVLWLVSYVRQISRRALQLAFAVFVALTVAILVLLAARVSATNSPVVSALAVSLV